MSDSYLKIYSVILTFIVIFLVILFIFVYIVRINPNQCVRNANYSLNTNQKQSVLNTCGDNNTQSCVFSVQDFTSAIELCDNNSNCLAFNYIPSLNQVEFVDTDSPKVTADNYYLFTEID